MTETHALALDQRKTPRVLARFLEVVSAFARLPLPGHGDTWERFEILALLAEEDLSLARLGRRARRRAGHPR